MVVLWVFFGVMLSVVEGQLQRKYVTDFRNAFDTKLHASVLDEEKCFKQLEILSNHSLGLRFLDATGKIPSGIMEGNFNALGDYFECLAIDQVLNNLAFQGKYCSLKIPIQQQLLVSEKSLAWSDMAYQLGIDGLPINYYVDMLREISDKSFTNVKKYIDNFTGFGQKFNISDVGNSLVPFNITMGVCIPHTCTTEQVVEYFITRYVPVLNLTYSEFFCRLPNDKPFTAADYTVIVIFSVLGVITIISTSYDIYNTLILKRNRSEINRLYQSFSVYTNTRRLVTFIQEPGSLDCVDGIRTLSMLWVVLGHTYTSIMFVGVHNTKYILEWSRFFTSTWLHSATVTVDTFFFLSGMLSVYSTVKKFNRGRFMRNIHFFYILRLLRMLPLLAAMVLLQVSLLHHASDGPNWKKVASSVEYCNKFWWSALLHVQNYVNPLEVCIGPTWYLSVDVQLYILSPLVIVWMFGKEYVAFIALAIAIILSLIASTYYSFTYDLGVVIGNPARTLEFDDYLVYYYYNTPVRASPFIVGMVFGYLLHLYRGKTPNISKVNTTLLWMLSIMMLTFSIVCVYPTMQKDYDLQVYDNILNSYMRFIWACGLGWVIFACAKGYGGPVNWFLSLYLWKLPARLSYGVYLLHMPLILILQGSWVKSQYFSEYDSTSRFMAVTMMSFMLSFFMTIIIDSAFSTILKMFLTGKSTPQALTSKPEIEKCNREQNFYKTSL
ncbi:nose resistant to fluoxetine protein 6 [Manduca sexta]|uniref:nose resistant to fluoxetine protein 6 n=1 Tax=Manduca sexta TaxID=7130 RepID=UPI00189030F9|nr:nose resistant to fluoxetine protein 6 [Manduca sexta]